MKRLLAMLLACVAGFSLTACGSSSTTTQTNASSEATSSGNSETSETTETSYTIDNSYAEDTDALVEQYASLFEQVDYTDSKTGLSITYNVFLPEGYDESKSYPMVVFIGDSSCAGTDASYSLTQGRGALVWAASEWQAANPTIIIVPTYPETILDDHRSYTTTEYVEMTKNFIEDMEQTYAVDTNRVYGTGQSMGCMTTLILATEYPELYSACMFVDGQWDISTLSNLTNLNFVYFAAEDDTNAYNGMQEVMSMFDENSVSYNYAQWDGTWSTDELTSATTELFNGESNAYFISWTSGTIEPKSGAGSGGSDDPMASMEAPSGSFPGPDSESGDSKPFPGSNSESSPESAMPDNNDISGSINSSAYHMASFDYAYRCISVMEWLFQQTK